MTIIKSLFFLILYLIFFKPSHIVWAATVKTGTNPETGLKSWTFTHEGLDLKLIQRYPDQTRAFFIARGFTSEQANDIATNCVFQTAAKNINSKENGSAIGIDLRQWRVIINGKEQGIKLKEQWKKQWQALHNTDKAVKMSAQIAFRWSTFPTQQTFEAGGDYNWGMISFGLPPGTKFDLLVQWSNNNKNKIMLINHIVCPEDQS